MFATARAKQLKSFRPPFSKGGAVKGENRTGGVVGYPPTLCVFCRRPQTAKFLIVRRRHRRVNAKPKAWQRGDLWWECFALAK